MNKNLIMKPPIKQIVISGWYGNQNLGDDAILSATLYMIERFLPNSEITVLSDNPEVIKAQHHIKSIRRRGILARFRFLQTLFKADLFLLGGGELLYDKGIGGEAVNWLKEIVWSKLMGTPSMYFNGGVGLVYNKNTKYVMKHVCNAIDLISVRDERSKLNLISLGVKKPIHVGADCVFALNDSVYFTERKDCGDRRLETKAKVGINLRPWLYRLEEIPEGSHKLCEDYGGMSSDYEDFKKVIVKTIEYLRKAKNANIVMFPISFFKKAMDEDDMALLEEIGHLLTDWNGVTLLGDECTPIEMMNHMREFKMVIGSRLHALVFSAFVKTPFIAISYDPKIQAFMAQTGQEEYSLNMNEVTTEILIQKIDLLWEKRGEVSRQLEATLPEIASKSESSAHLMGDLLNSKRSKTNIIFEGIILAIKIMPWALLITMHDVFRRIRILNRLPFWIRISLIFEKINRKDGNV